MQRAFALTLLALLFLLPLYFRTHLEAKWYLERAEESLAKGTDAARLEAVHHLRDALSWSAPFQPHSERARKLLSELAFSQELDEKVRLFVLREYRRGVM